MGYLNKAAGLADFSKAVISLWFRVPAASLAAAAAQSDGGVMQGIVPLLVFGDPTVMGYVDGGTASPGAAYTREEWTYDDTPASPSFHQYTLNADTHVTSHLSDITNSGGAERAQPPSFLGIDTQFGETSNVLRFHIQMSGAVGTGAGMAYDSSGTVGGDQIVYSPTSVSLDVRGAGGGAPAFFTDAFGFDTFYVPGENPWVTTGTLTDKSDYVFNANTEFFEVALKTAVTPNTWHHVLISFDLTGSVTASGKFDDLLNRVGGVLVAGGPDLGSIASDSKIWIAFDDVNKSGGGDGGALDFDIDYGRVEDTLGANDFPTANATFTAAASSVQNQDYVLAKSGYKHDITVTGASLPSYSYSPGTITTDAHPLALPASTASVGRVQVVEMAELQIYTGVTLDTSNSTNRRAFVTADGRPQTDFTIPDALLGKSPEIRLHTRAKWQAGANTGTAGNLAKTGTIDPFTPGPSLT